MSEFPLELGNTRGLQESRMIKHQTEKKFDDIFSRFDTIYECGGQTGTVETARHVNDTDVAK